MGSARSVLIVGGGVVGLCIAYYAMQEGHNVTILERGKADHDGCSLGNAGMVVPSHFVPLAAPGMVAYGLRAMLHPESPFYVRPRLDPDLIRWGLLFQRSATKAHVERAAPALTALHLASRGCYEAFADLFGGAFRLTRRGLLMLCKEEKTLHEEGELVPKAIALGMPAQLLSAAESAALDPGIEMDIAGSVYFPMDCHFNPSEFVGLLTEAIVRGGVQIVWGTEVTGWRTAEGGGGDITEVVTSAGEYRADEVVLAAGSWSPSVARDLKLDIPLQAGKGYSVTVAAPKQLPEICSILTEARVAVTPMGRSLRFGGTMEITGLDESVSRPRVNGILNSIPKYFPAFAGEDYSHLPVWKGLRPCSPDGLPYVGRAPRYRNLTVATGHAMMGMSLAPITGKIVAALLAGTPVPVDIDLLRVDRFSRNSA